LVVWITRHFLPREVLFLRQREPFRYQRKLIGRGLQFHKRHHLRLSILLDLRSSPTVLSVSVLITPSKAWSSPSYRSYGSITLNRIIVMLVLVTPQDICGGDGRNRTAVRNTFPSTSYNNNLYITIIFMTSQSTE